MLLVLLLVRALHSLPVSVTDPVQPTEVIIVAVVPSRSDLLGLLKLVGQRLGDTLQVNLVRVASANELRGHNDLGVKVFLFGEQVELSLDDPVNHLVEHLLRVSFCLEFTEDA